MDHLYTNKPDKLSDVTAHVNGGSDHRMLQVVRYAKSMKRNVRYIRKRCFKHFDEKNFKTEIKQLKWFEVYTCTDPNKAVQLLTEKISEVLDKFAPVRTIQVRSRYAPWISEEVKAKMIERDRAQQAAAATQAQEDWRLFRNLRNTVTNFKESKEIMGDQTA